MSVFSISEYYDEQPFIEQFHHIRPTAEDIAFQLINLFIDQELHGEDALSTEFIEQVRRFSEQNLFTQALIRDLVHRMLGDEPTPLPEGRDWTDFSATLGVALVILEQGFDAS